MSGFVMLCALVMVTIAVVLHSRARAASRARGAASDEARRLSAAARVAVEDVDRFGEELAALDAKLAGRRVDEATLTARGRAREAYESACRTLRAVQHSDEIAQVTRALESGRYAIACARARLQGRPMPAKRPPCFFNPAHGPSVRDVAWTLEGGQTREVPACRADCERIAAGADPYIRTVPVGSERVPYWRGGDAYAPYARGYYAAWSRPGRSHRGLSDVVG